MNSLVEGLLGMDTMTDQVIATDLLISAKSSVKNYAFAITESNTQDVKTTLYKQLNEAIDFHEEVINYMMDRGWYHPYNADEQIRLDLNTGQTALNIANHGNLGLTIE